MTPPLSPSPSVQQPDPAEIVAEAIRVRGIVQGVGFRPTVYRIATALALRGDVCNDGQGVLIHLVGARSTIDTFVMQLQQECPPLAQITAIDRQPGHSSLLSSQEFVIIQSVHNTVQTQISTDAATCSQCQADILNSFSRWYRYPFTNCTHCGPRLSIIRAIPYDRPNTSMAAFPLCSDCARDYETLSDRRFHAQPIACPVCGPQIWLERVDGQAIEREGLSSVDDLDAVATLLQQGQIVAIKGIGGIHLACDATQEATVQTLRQRKHRYHKPFALMARDLTLIQQYCIVTPVEQKLLTSPAAPIVLLQPKTDCPSRPIAPSVAPDASTLGFMLPYSPLHHLILQQFNRPIVLTSGNLSNEPQCIDNEVARSQLGAIADYFVFHNREIINRVDDSVVRVVNDRPQLLRRARGYAPAPIALPPDFAAAPPILAMGSELKNTFCLLRQGQAILSQHLGDLENPAADQAYQESLNLYLNLFEHQPQLIAVDHHPDYRSTQLGKELAIANHLPYETIQHHHAHIAACMAEHQLPLDAAPVLGIALDGLGYGLDQTLWGGEFLLADYRDFQRLAHFKPVAMLGGVQAIYQPWRNTYAQLLTALSWDDLQQQYGDLELIQFLAKQPRLLLDAMLKQNINSPLTSSCGRLFDAVAAALGLCRVRCTYEGQGAIQLEAIATPHLTTPRIASQLTGYPFAIDETHELQPAPMWQQLLTDLKHGIEPAVIAARFHLGLTEAIEHLTQRLRHTHAVTKVVLTGGVFQNRLLQQRVHQKLTQLGLTVLTHQQVPPNDGGLSLGQAAIAAARLLARSNSS